MQQIWFEVFLSATISTLQDHLHYWTWWDHVLMVHTYYIHPSCLTTHCNTYFLIFGYWSQTIQGNWSHMFSCTKWPTHSMLLTFGNPIIPLNINININYVPEASPASRPARQYNSLKFWPPVFTGHKYELQHSTWSEL